MLFLVAMLFSIGQILLTEQLFYAVNKDNKKRAFVFAISKFMLYGVAVALSLNKGLWHFDLLLSGYISGIPVAVIALYIYRAVMKK